MPIETFVTGNLVRVSMTLKDSAGTLIDPTGLTFTYKPPTGNATTWTFGVDSELVKDGVGLYHADIDANQAGKWRYRWESTGTGQAAKEGEFEITKSLI